MFIIFCIEANEKKKKKKENVELGLITMMKEHNKIISFQEFAHRTS